MKSGNRKSSNRVTAGLLASAMAVSAFALAPTVNGLPLAHAEAVKVDGPKMQGFAEVVQAVSPAVVSVRVEQAVQPASDTQGEFRFDRRFNDRNVPEFFRDNPDFFERFFGRPGPRDERKPHRRFGMSQGSGFFISEDGFLVTNNHVVDGGEQYTIVMDDGTEYDAKLVGADERSDLAVLKVDADRKFTYVDFANENPLIGDWVVAVGNPFGLGGTVTAGIVSANGREIATNRYDDFIQIDAAVNKGNSGGPAFNLSGEVIGVNTAIFSPSGGNVGIAFAIPANSASQIVDELMSEGSVVRGWLGVQIQPVTEDIADALDLKSTIGAMVTEPQQDGPASKAGVQSGDVITAVDGNEVKNPRDLARKIASYDPDTEVELTVFRNGEEQTISVTLGQLSQMAAVNPDGNDQAGPEENTGKLGLALGPSEDGEGVMVMQVRPDSAADQKGIQKGDVVASVNGKKVNSPRDVADQVTAAEKDGKKNTLFQVRRDGNSRFVALPLDKG